MLEVLEELVEEMIKHKVEVIGIIEIKKKENGMKRIQKRKGEK